MINFLKWIKNKIKIVFKMLFKISINMDDDNKKEPEPKEEDVKNEI